MAAFNSLSAYSEMVAELAALKAKKIFKAVKISFCEREGKRLYFWQREGGKWSRKTLLCQLQQLLLHSSSFLIFLCTVVLSRCSSIAKKKGCLQDQAKARRKSGFGRFTWQDNWRPRSKRIFLAMMYNHAKLKIDPWETQSHVCINRWSLSTWVPSEWPYRRVEKDHKTATQNRHYDRTKHGKTHTLWKL